MSELKPCPFCGARYDQNHKGDCYFLLEDGGIADKRIIKAWNTRTEAEMQEALRLQREAFDYLFEHHYTHHTPYMVCIPKDKWRNFELMLSASIEDKT